jgi:hypothetical protein
MELTDKERKFVAKRAKLVQAWPLVGGVLLCLVLGVGVWLFLFMPLLANPFAVLTKLNSGSVPASTLTVMAGVLPVSVLMCLVLAIAIVLFCFVAFVNEKKYIRMIRRMAEPEGIPKQSGSEETGAVQKATPADTVEPSR